jgi:hypothetical protein
MSRKEGCKEIIYSMPRLMQTGELYTKKLDKKYQVSVPRFNYLLTLYENSVLPLSQIAKHIIMKISTITGIYHRSSVFYWRNSRLCIAYASRRFK